VSTCEELITLNPGYPWTLLVKIFAF